MQTIFIIDDDIDYLYLTKHFLESWGFDCIINSTGEFILETLETNTVDVILIDVHIGFLDGREICRNIQKSK
jgi:DNA-binding response OmpR family regulator